MGGRQPSLAQPSTVYKAGRGLTAGHGPPLIPDVHSSQQWVRRAWGFLVHRCAQSSTGVKRLCASCASEAGPRSCHSGHTSHPDGHGEPGEDLHLGLQACPPQASAPAAWKPPTRAPACLPGPFASVDLGGVGTFLTLSVVEGSGHQLM